jgi:hypothetical protein
METISPAPRPSSITIIGWTTVMASAIMIVMNVASLLSYKMLDSLDLNLSSSLLSQYMPQSMKKVMDLYRYSRWWTWYGILFFGFVVVAGVQFLRLRAWGRKALEAACWIGLLNGFIDTVLSYTLWQSSQESLSLVMRQLGGSQYSYLNPLGLLTIIVGFFLWIIPSVAMIVYLRRPKIKEVVSAR